MGKNHSLWARMARNWDKMVFSQRMSTCQTQDLTQRGEKSHFKWHIYSPRPEIFQRHRGVVSGLKKPQRNKRKKEEKKKNKASQSTNNLVCWALARDADGSDLRPSEQRNALQHSQRGPSHKPILGVPLSPSGWEKKKTTWFYLAVGKALLLKPQGGLWDEKEAGPFPPWFWLQLIIIIVWFKISH